MKALTAALCLALSSCGSKAAVAVSARIDQVTLSLDSASALASALRGSFVLHLGLGQVAPSSTDVTVRSFSLVRASDQGPLIVLSVAAVPAGVIHLEPGGTADVTNTIMAQSMAAQVVTPAQVTTLCAAGNVQIVGEVADTASGGSTPVTSASLTLGGTGCPPP